jgi:hypothetical protein
MLGEFLAVGAVGASVRGAVGASAAKVFFSQSVPLPA